MAKKKTLVPKKELTFEQKKKLFLTPCKNKDELKSWIRYFLNLDLPDVTVSRHATTNPLLVVWEIYSICVLRQNPESIQELLYVASRGSGKTLGAAIAEFMIMIHDQRDIAHVGAIMAQAKRAYEYIQGFCVAENVKPIIDPKDTPEADKILQKSTMERSVFQVNGEKCTMEVLPTTMKALNGVHCSLVSCDELDTLDGEGLRAIKEVAGMLDTKKGKKPLRIGISTRKSKAGLMNKMMEGAINERGVRVRHIRQWTALEFTERCPDSRSGTAPAEYWLNVEKGEVLTHADYAKLDSGKRKEFFLETSMYEKCLTCPVAVFCRGDAKKQTSTSKMLKTIDELNQKITGEGYDWASSQLFNLKPSTEGIVFKEFDERLHVKDWNQLWLILTGREFPGTCTHDIFVKKCLEMDLPCYGGIDWGWSSPNTVVYLFVDPRENVYIVQADGMTYISQPMWIHHLKTKYQNKYRCQLYMPDLADKGSVLEMQKAGLPVANDASKPEINASVQTIKKFLRVPGMTQPKLYIAKETCQPLISELGVYHYKVNAAGIPTDDPEDSDNHWIDALRYIMSKLFGKTNIILGQGLGFDDLAGLQDKQGNFQRAPTAAEYALTQGLRINQEEPDVSKLGRIGTASELDKQEGDDDTTNGNGSFLWSF
jgi:hypothetical protein